MLHLRGLQRKLGLPISQLDSTKGIYQVGTKNGFLPRVAPLIKYDAPYSKMNSIMAQVPVNVRTQPLSVLLKELPKYNFPKLDMTNKTQNLLWSLYRDYAFLASAYLLEPCYRNFVQIGHMNTLAHDVLPAQIAQPLNYLATQLGGKPYLEYTHYATHNWQSKTGDISRFENFSLIRSFEGSASESGFILVHVQIMNATIPIVSLIVTILNKIISNQPIVDEMKKLNLQMTIIYRLLHTMWQRSNPADYNRFRVFIFGILNQKMFPNGVIYEGVDSQPRYYRGESGANDNLIPLLDNFTQLTFPDNELTAALRDFRTYRPQTHQDFINSVAQIADKLEVANYCLQKEPMEYVRLLMNIADFRALHWHLTKEYIIKRSKHPTATGGTPITRWLPNQLLAVYHRIIETTTYIPGRQGLAWRKMIEQQLDRVHHDIQKLS